MKKVSAEGRIKRLFNGDYVKVRGISPALLDLARARVQDPKAPVVLTDSGEEIVNYQDPVYQEELRAVEQKRTEAMINAMVLFGLELVDADGNPIKAPADAAWERKLRRFGVDWREFILDVMGAEEFEDEEDEELARQDAYMLLTAFSAASDDIELIRKISGLEEMAQALAEGQFPGNAPRVADTEV